MEMMRVILLGSFAGNNAGDMVVLESVINDLKNLPLPNVPKAKNSIFADMDSGMEIQLVIPSLNDRGMCFIDKVIGTGKRISIIPVPIDKNPIAAIGAVRRLVKEFAGADYIYTTAGILFDRKIWNPFYNFVTAYTPLLLWARQKNPNLKIIGYNVGIISESRTVGRCLLKKCIQLHDCIYLREERDFDLLEALGYKGTAFVSADNVFGYYRPCRYKERKTKKLYLNLTLYGVSNKEKFVQEITRFVAGMKSSYEIYFFQTSKRDLEIAREIIRRADLGENHMYYLGLMGYVDIQRLLSDCELLVGMRMHSIIFALKQCCPVIAISYSAKVSSLMRDMNLDNYLIDMKELSAQILEAKIAMSVEQWQEVAERLYTELERRYAVCSSYK